MRPQITTVSAIAAAVASFAALQTLGAAGNLTLAAPPALVSAQNVTLTSTANLSAISFTITGKDAENRVITEVLAGPNANTVTSINQFLTVTSIRASAAVATAVSAGNAATAVSPWVPLNITSGSWNVGLGIVVAGTITYDVEYSYDDIFDLSPMVDAIFTHSLLTAKTAKADGNLPYMCNGVRLKQTAGTGSAAMYVVQGRAL